MTTPQIIMGDYEGVHNRGEETAERVKRSRIYKDLSTVCVIPTRGTISARVVENWMGLMPPMNHPFIRMFVSGLEVGEAYTAAIETILANDALKDWKYVMTMEEDNMPPADGLLKMFESMETFDVVGGLYYTKGEGGMPQIYGAPGVLPMFNPQLPQPDTVQECNGLGMGFNLFKLEIFKDEKIPKPWFKTVQEFDPVTGGGRGYTQDLYFYENARKAGYRIACDTRIKVGHFDPNTGIVW